MRKTKIIASIGPATDSFDCIVRLIREGVDCFRINFSHGDQETWKRYIGYVREAEKYLNREVGILGDLCGPNIRLGNLKSDLRVEKGATYSLKLSDRSDGDFIPLPAREAFEVVDP